VAVVIKIKNFSVVPLKILCFLCQAFFTSLTLFLQMLDCCAVEALQGYVINMSCAVFFIIVA